MLHDLALEDPNLDADDAVSGDGAAVTEIDVGAQRVQRHAAFAVPFGARDFRAAKTAGDVDADADGAETQCRLHGALHGAAEGDAALELLGDAFGDQRRVDLGLADLDDVQVDFRLGETAEIRADALDLLALLADQDARARGVHGDAALLVRALDDDLRDPGFALILQNVGADGAVFVQQLGVFARAGVPAAVPVAIDAEAKSDGIDLLTHVISPPWQSSWPPAS